MSDHTNGQMYKMGTVSQLTGFSPTLLRAWERRYGFLQPQRMAGGHRLYTEQDLKVLERVKHLLDQGLSVGQAAVMGRETLLTGNDQGETPEARQLAPNDLEIHRQQRFSGEGLGVSIRDLSPGDLTTVCRLYDLVKRCYELWLYMDEDRNLALLTERLERLAEPDLVAAVARLGCEVSPRDPLVKAALEDARWGALGPLLNAVDRRHSPWTVQALTVAVMLARDHAKMLRNSFTDLDVTLRQADESPKVHNLGAITRKLDGLRWENQTVERMLDWDAPVSSRCLETSTIDRILYDFVRRAHQADCTQVRLHLLRCNPKLVRFAFELDRPHFRAHASDDLATLAVSRAVGVSAKAALEQGYLGQKNMSKSGWAWFHWPTFTPPPGAETCSCEH